MSPDSKFYARLAIGSNRQSLGHAPLPVLFVRASQEILKSKHKADMIITLELSPAKLPDSTVFDKSARLEQSLASQISTDLEDDSPFPGISVGRVAEAMSSPEYESYAAICEPSNRIGVADWDVQRIQDEYGLAFPDCFGHFPKWVD